VASTTQVANPWEHRRWRGGVCRRGLGGKAIAFWITGLVFGGVAAAIILKDPSIVQYSRFRWEMLFPVGFATIGLGFGIGALIATARWLRFGRCLVRLQTMPGVIGGHFRGELLLPESFPRDTDVRMELFCDETATTPAAGSDNHSSTSVSRKWTNNILVSSKMTSRRGGHCIVPFDFTIPYGLVDETDSHRNGNITIDVRWNLRTFAKLNGPDLDITYRVPVFRTAESDPSVSGEPEHRDLDSLLRDTGELRRVRIESTNGVPAYVCDSRSMKKGLSVWPLIIGIVFLTIAVAVPCVALPGMVKDIVPKKADGWENLFLVVPLFFALIPCIIALAFGLFGLLLLWIGLHSLVSRRTWVQSGTIHQRNSLFGIPWRRSYPCNTAASVEIGDTTSSGTRTWRSIVIRRNTGTGDRVTLRHILGSITVATDISTQEEAESLCAKLRQDLRLPADADGLHS